MWVIGGYDTNSMKNDVWWSTDGVTWPQATAAAAFTPPRTLTQALVLNNQLCIVAGYDGPRAFGSEPGRFTPRMAGQLRFDSAPTSETHGTQAVWL